MSKSAEVIIIGGSYAGLSAAMTLGRARRTVILIDSGKPCNRQTPHAHNLIGHDGDKPADLARAAKAQVLAYPGIRIIQGRVTGASGGNGAFSVETEAGQTYTAPKLLLATGVRDIPMPIPGFAECWGISVLHCPYCHGYEVRDEALGIIANGDAAFEYARLISQWSPNLTVFTNGPSTLSEEQLTGLGRHRIDVQGGEIAAIEHEEGYLSHLVFTDGSKVALKAVFARGAIAQHDDIAVSLGCTLGTDMMTAGLITVDETGRTGVPGLWAAGDNCTPMRTLSVAMAAGMKAGAFINHELITEAF